MFDGLVEAFCTFVLVVIIVSVSIGVGLAYLVPWIWHNLHISWG